MRYLTLILLLLSTIARSQQIEGTQITSPLVPNDIKDNYPTHIDSLGFGGYRVVADTIQRNAIKSTRRIEGMLVYSLSDSTLYMLKDISSNEWSTLTTQLSDIDTIPNNLVIQGGLDIIGNPPSNYPEILLSVKDADENQRMLVTKNGLLMAGRLHISPLDIDGLYIIGAKNYLGGMNSSASGYNVYNNSDTTQAFGNYLHTGDKNNSILIGTGKSESEPLLLDRDNSVQIGANSTTPNIIMMEDTTVIEDLLIVNDTAKINVLEVGSNSVTAIAEGDTLATVKYVDDNAGGDISGNNNEILMSDGSGGTKTATNFSWDSNSRVMTFGSRSGTIGNSSTAWGGGNEATKIYSTVWGLFNKATGDKSTTWGQYSEASGYDATAWGSGCLASGSYATSFGQTNIASGSHATAWGYTNESHDFTETVLGQFNKVGTGNQTSWVDIDNLFIIGNGTSIYNRSNAFEIKKNGNTTINGGLEISTTTDALIVPRMTTTQRDALTAVNGMIIYNTTTNAFNFYENGSWVTK